MTRKDDGEINNSWETWDSHGIPNNWVLVPHFRFEQNLQQVLGANFRLKIIEVMISAISTMYHSPPTNIS